LQAQKWLTEDEEVIGIEKPGEGNMNVVVRVKAANKSIIAKQARGFVQKYPDISAPIERIAVESDFYKLVSEIKHLKGFMPTIIGYDAENYVMAMEDLGVGSDFSHLYKKNVHVTNDTINAAIGYLSELHNHKFPEETITNFSNNLALRKLNYEHLFVYPLMKENGFNLDDVQDGLQTIAMTYKTDKVLNEKMANLGESYLSSGNVLLHGDYYPGSWLNVNEEFKVIDPEFCFFGKPEYDLGVMIANLKMAQATDNQISEVWKRYKQPARFSEKLTNKFIGMELIRRMIGLAQLPLELSLEEKKNLLEEARKFVVNE
jgi:5-methylthioribose kinase